MLVPILKSTCVISVSRFPTKCLLIVCSGIEPEDLRAVFDFLYSGRISIRGPGVLRALQELGCFHILPLLDEVWQEGCPTITVEDKYHAINFLNRLKEFKENRNYIDFSFRVQVGYRFSK